MRFIHVAIVVASISGALARPPHRQARRQDVAAAAANRGRPGRPTKPTPVRPTKPTINPGGPIKTIPTSSPSSSTTSTSTTTAGKPTSTKTPCGSCSLTKYVPTLPAGFSIPSGQVLVAAGLGVGVQNYTCSADTSKYTSVGAVARLYDQSCILGTPLETSIETLAQAAQAKLPSSVTAAITKALGKSPVTLGDHYFLANPYAATPPVAPDFDFRTGAKRGDPLGYAIVFKSLGVPAANTTRDVDSLQLANGGQTTPISSGNLAKTVFRLKTSGGQPPSSCTPGTSPPTSIPYAAQYLFYA